MSLDFLLGSQYVWKTLSAALWLCPICTRILSLLAKPASTGCDLITPIWLIFLFIIPHLGNRFCFGLLHSLFSHFTCTIKSRFRALFTLINSHNNILINWYTGCCCDQPLRPNISPTLELDANIPLITTFRLFYSDDDRSICGARPCILLSEDCFTLLAVSSRWNSNGFAVATQWMCVWICGDIAILGFVSFVVLLLLLRATHYCSDWGRNSQYQKG